MPLLNRLTDKGAPLTSIFYGGESDTIREIPPEFRAVLPMTVIETPMPWDQGIPALSDTILASKAEQKVTSERTQRVTYKPAGIYTLVEKFTDKDKELCTRTRNFRPITDMPSIAVPTLLRDVNTKNLGNYHFIEEIEDKPGLFSDISSSIETPDLLPEIFRAVLPLYTREETVSGAVVDPPVLGVGDQAKTESQLDLFSKKVRTSGRGGVSYPQSVVALKHIGGMEFGGEVTQITGYLDITQPPVETGIDVVSSEVKNLGNGTWFRQTEKWFGVARWPILVGTEVDPRTGIIINITKKVVDAGTLGGIDANGYVDIKPLDKWRSVYIASKLDTSSLPSTLIWETTAEYSFPHTLIGATWLWGAASAPCAYDYDASLVLDMHQGYAGPCRAKVTESFSNGPPATTISVTTFFPQSHMIGYAWAFACDPGGDVGIARAAARTFNIPPSLHAAITIAGSVTLVNGVFTDTLPATTPTALPASGSLITKSCEVERWRFGVFYRRLVELYVP